MPEGGEASTRLVSIRLTGLLLLFILASPGLDVRAAQDESTQGQVLAPGWRELEFEPPQAGSYQLPPIGMAGDGRVITSEGEETTLHALMGDKVVVLSFIYSSCSDANGCPLATHVLEKLQDRLLVSTPFRIRRR
jgi:cytochrome c peroxidase